MLRRRWLELAPDEPAYVDTRGVLLEDPELFGGPAGGVAVRSGGRLWAAVGRPDRRSFEAALAVAHPEAELVATGAAAGQAGRVLGIEGIRFFVHQVGPSGLRRSDGLPEAGLLDPRLSVERFSEEIRRELRELSGRRPVGAVLVDDSPVSVCYPALVTERFWDVSIETLDGFRRAGRAAAAFLRLALEMAVVGREAVWGAVEDNTASLALAARLGFVRVGEATLFELSRRRT